MNVAVNLSLCAFKTDKTANGNVFTDFGNGFGNNIFYQFAVQFRSKQGVDISRIGFYDMLGNGFRQCLEVFVFAYKVGFAVNFYDYAGFSVFGNMCCYSAFRCNAAGFLRSLGQAFFTQEVYSLFHIAFGGYQGFFAVHHSRAGPFTQFFNNCSCNLCHIQILLYFKKLKV